MTIESATYLNDLNSSYPAGGDQKKEGNDHIALVKAVLKATLPGLAGRAWRRQTKSGTYTAAVTDNMSLLAFTSTATLNLLAAATAGNGYLLVAYAGSGVVLTIDPDSSETIGGASTWVIGAGDFIFLFCDGTTWYPIWIQAYDSTALTAAALLRPTLGSPRENISSGNASGAQALDLANQSYFAYTLTGNVTFSFSNVPGAGSAICVTLELTQDGTGGRTITWPGSVVWPSGLAPTPTATAGKRDIFTLMSRDGGTTWFGFVAGQNY